MDTLSFKTISVNKETAKKEWVVIDATDQVVVAFAQRLLSCFAVSTSQLSLHT